MGPRRTTTSVAQQPTASSGILSCLVLHARQKKETQLLLGKTETMTIECKQLALQRVSM